jgi:hypothetical protein
VSLLSSRASSAVLSRMEGGGGGHRLPSRIFPRILPLLILVMHAVVIALKVVVVVLVVRSTEIKEQEVCSVALAEQLTEK